MIYAPFPAPELVRGGWMARIAAVDRLFADRRRLYVYPRDPVQAVDPFDYRVQPVEVAPNARFAWLDLRFSNHHRWLGARIDEADFVYAHSSHSAQHLLPYYRTGKIVTDLHGLASEEELLQGSPERARFFAGLEEEMVRGSAALVTVTAAMAAYLRGKYPGLQTAAIRLPIVDGVPREAAVERPVRSVPRVVYAGGVQSWQNVDRMMATVARCRERFEFHFYTDAIAALRTVAERHGVADLVRIRTVAPDRLPAIHAEADYGFVLRDDLAVNRVSCPTKLSEYLAFGVVPVVLHEAIGDFLQLDYRYVRLVDFEAGRLPEARELSAMRRRNLEVFEAIRRDFATGSRRLQQLVVAPRESMAAKAAVFLTTFERSAFYPVRGVRVVIDRDSGRHVVRLSEPGSAVVDCTLELPGSGAIRTVTLGLAGPPFVLTPVVAELSDAQGATYRLDLQGAHRVDRFGNHAFDVGVGACDLRAEIGGGFAATHLRLCFEFVLVGPEVMLAGARPALSARRWFRRLVTALRRLLRRG